MKRVLFTVLIMIILSACTTEEVIPTATPEPVIDEIVFDQVMDDGNVYTSRDFFEAGFKEYKKYNVSKLTGATEAWYGYWGPDEDSNMYYELRFYPNHSTAVSEGTAFAEDDTGEDAKLRRQDTMWRTGLPDRKRTGPMATIPLGREWRLSKYADYMIYDNVIMLCMGEDSNEAFQLCNDLIDILNK
jgi:hypothetical protein